MKRKPKEIIEKEKDVYIELSEKQINDYVVIDNINGSCYFRYDYLFDGKKGTVKSNFKAAFDAFDDNTDYYLYNDDFKIFFNFSKFNGTSSNFKDIIEFIKNELRDQKINQLLNGTN